MFHITRGGRAAPCEASIRVCPLGEHYGSLQAAARAALVRDLNVTPPGSTRGLPDSEQPDGLPDGHTATTRPPSPTVTFGKYKGQPVSKLLADRGYCHWLLDKDWFREDYPDLYRQIRERKEVVRLRNDFNRL